MVVIKYLLISFILLDFPLRADPWGKDADLCLVSEKILEEKSSFLGQLAGKAIQFHQNVLSPADGPRSHFYPSSSQYTLEAMKKYGLLTGFTMGCDRLMRENSDPWLYRKICTPQGVFLKWDPVQ